MSDVERYAAIARQRIDTDWIDWHDEIDDETGHKIKLQTRTHPTYGDVTTEIDLTRMYRTAPRRSGNYDIFRTEAEIVDDGGSLENPAIPTSNEVAEKVTERLQEQGLEPAWWLLDDVEVGDDE